MPTQVAVARPADRIRSGAEDRRRGARRCGRLVIVALVLVLVLVLVIVALVIVVAV